MVLFTKEIKSLILVHLLVLSLKISKERTGTDIKGTLMGRQNFEG
jgi:hypothetical protein